jgi:hypothetical protein
MIADGKRFPDVFDPTFSMIVSKRRAGKGIEIRSRSWGAERGLAGATSGRR